MATLKPAALLLIALLGAQANADDPQASKVPDDERVAHVKQFLEQVIENHRRSWIEQPDPNALTYDLNVAPECPFGRSRAAEIIEGAIVRSRIKPQPLADVQDLGGKEPKLFLSAAVDCLPRDWGDNYVFVVNVDWANYGSLVDPIIVYPTLGQGNFGSGDARFILDAFGQAVEDALVDYLKANFDL